MKSPLTIAFAIASVKLLLFLYVGGRYGYFRDELYFLASTDHLAFGYPDHSPLSIWIGAASKTIFGDSLYAIRFLPALAGALKIILTGLIVREFGGKHLATLLACICVLAAPVYLSIDNLMGMNAYEPVFWMGCVLSYLWAVKKENPSYWLMFGAFVGLGLMNKHSTFFFALALAAGFIITQDRKAFKNVHIWIGAGVAFLLFLPNVIWQYQNDWATLELLRNVAASGKNVVLAPHQFIFQQILIHNPLTFPVWLAGLVFLLFRENGRRFRALGLAYLITLGLMIYFAAKHYYLSPVYPMLFAAGGVFWEDLLSSKLIGKVAMAVHCAFVLAVGAVLAPMAVPLIPVQNVPAYAAAIGLPSTKTEVGHTGELPQIFGDQFGWEEMVAQVADVYRALPEEDRKKAAIFGGNYGQAGAIDKFGTQFGLPKAISPHQSYFLWGPRDYDGSVVILLGTSVKDAERYFESVEKKTRVDNPFSMPYEKYNILVCRNLKKPLMELWPELKNWR
ncbi:MAG: glycosyltransferase family 39 protein [Acidobacteriota bacterium]|nr:glycosyltransferase family 39 protein [Acidobacteriota bacterium]MDH3528549.1 glycosyltransferase family 39 protein [Acidobacteriota bacterium]